MCLPRDLRLESSMIVVGRKAITSLHRTISGDLEMRVLRFASREDEVGKGALKQTLAPRHIEFIGGGSINNLRELLHLYAA